MPSANETGHAKNVANLSDLISFCTGYGPTYNPSKASIKLASLNTLLADAQTTINEVNIQNTAYNNAVNTRILAFKNLKPLSTRIVNALSATDATTETIKDAKTVNKKVQGQRATAIPTQTDPNLPAPATISTSQQSYDQLIQHLDRMLTILNAEPTYTPNEADLQIATLTAYQNTLITANNNVTATYTDISNARITRNTTLYKKTTGLYDIAMSVKDYVKSVFGSTSPQYKQISKIQFTKPR